MTDTQQRRDILKLVAVAGVILCVVALPFLSFEITSTTQLVPAKAPPVVHLVWQHASLDQIQAEIDRDSGLIHAALYQNQTLLELAVAEDRRDIVELLIERGASIDGHRDAVERGAEFSPLFVAILYQHEDMAIYLLDKGVDPNLTGAFGATPLDEAESKGMTDLAAKLRSAGGKHREELGTPHEAPISGSIKPLLESGAEQ
ncbi:MAG: hypothetical protein GC159_11065 [Phycisphaera sp.]|nr:hypothetical protein [Phycisphaera sp.]